MGNGDLERIHPKEIYRAFNEDSFKLLNERIQKIEIAMSRHMSQWNSPTLIRDASESTLIQRGYFFIDYTDFGGTFYTYFQKVFTTTYADTPQVIISLGPRTLNKYILSASTTLVSASEFRVELITSDGAAPTYGGQWIHWISAGKKILS